MGGKDLRCNVVGPMTLRALGSYSMELHAEYKSQQDYYIPLGFRALVHRAPYVLLYLTKRRNVQAWLRKIQLMMLGSAAQ